MKTLLISLVILLSSCGSWSKLPAAPSPGEYPTDSLAQVKITQVSAYNREAQKLTRKTLTKKTVTAIGITAFGFYCILAWRYEIE